jgi:hypothetical protein
MMQIFMITVRDEMFGDFNCQIVAENEAQAIKDAKELYAYELDTLEACIEIVSITVKPTV